jgi:hypothetical protein
MTRIPMLENIFGQPASHRGLLALHQGNQHATLRAGAEQIRLALWRGITPGDFRFVTEVTASESGFLTSK